MDFVQWIFQTSKETSNPWDLDPNASADSWTPPWNDSIVVVIFFGSFIELDDGKILTGKPY